MDHLLAGLLDLLREFDARQLPLTVGGGYGLYLKRQHLARTGERTLFAALPEAHSTNDIDLFLRADIVAEPEGVRKVAAAVSTLGFQPAEVAKYFRWDRPVNVGDVEQKVRLDILVGPISRVKDKIGGTPPRARAKGSTARFHARRTDEALHIDDQPIPVAVTGHTSDGGTYSGTVFVPEAFPYLLMKLHAYSDRKNDNRRDLGQHHALDAYSIVGMKTKDEFERAKRFGGEDRDSEHVRKVRRIIAEDFGSETSLGMLRMKEHPLFRPKFEIAQFLDVLKEIFAE